MALGREDYSGQQYEDAAAAFAKVDRNEPDALEAGFYRGISLLFSGKYPEAEPTMLLLSSPLAEVLNNEGVAVSRQDKDGSAQFVAAEAADPNQADYHFNLAVSLKHQGRTSGACVSGPSVPQTASKHSEAQELERTGASQLAQRTRESTRMRTLRQSLIPWSESRGLSMRLRSVRQLE